MQLRSQKLAEQEPSQGHESSESVLAIQTPTKREGNVSRDPAVEGFNFFLSLPEEVLIQVVCKMSEVKDLCALASTCVRMQQIVEGCSDHWKKIFSRDFVGASACGATVCRAAELATSWQKLYRSRHIAQLEVAPWERPSPFEVQAAIEQMLSINAPKSTSEASKSSSSSQVEEISLEEEENNPSRETCVIFLVDGSGSVTEEDFHCMTEFMQTAAGQISTAAASAGTTVRLGVVQFSNEVRVELAPTLIEENNESFVTAVHAMHRMNGGTNIAAAVQKAGQLLKNLSPECNRVLALLTDGRIDSYQAREAHDMTARLADEQGRVALHAFGVGRGVDRHEMLRIVSGACDTETAGNRYLPLMVLDDAPW